MGLDTKTYLQTDWLTDRQSQCDFDFDFDFDFDVRELTRVEAGSNTSTVAMRVVWGDEKWTQCLGV
jgi:hypothetical protein